MENPAELFQMRVAHVGMNASCKEEAKEWADTFLSLMGLSTRETSASYFAGDMVEIMQKNGRGIHGHIGFLVNDCQKALEYFTARGMHAVEETKKFDENGRCKFVYFEEQIGGFAIHLAQG